MRLLDLEVGAMTLTLVACLSLNNQPLTAKPPQPVISSPHIPSTTHTSTDSSLHCGVVSWRYAETEGNIRFQITNSGTETITEPFVVLKYAITNDNLTYSVVDVFALDTPLAMNQTQNFDRFWKNQRPWEAIETLACQPVQSQTEGVERFREVPLLP